MHNDDSNMRFLWIFYSNSNGNDGCWVLFEIYLPSPTSHLEKFRKAISLKWVIRSTSCLAQGPCFRGRRIEWRWIVWLIVLILVVFVWVSF